MQKADDLRSFRARLDKAAHNQTRMYHSMTSNHPYLNFGVGLAKFSIQTFAHLRNTFKRVLVGL